MYMDGIIAVSVVLQVVNFWLISKGRIVYPLIIMIYMMYVVVEGWLAWRDPDQALIWMYAALNLWAIWCGAVGWRNQWRKSRESTEY